MRKRFQEFREQVVELQKPGHAGKVKETSGKQQEQRPAAPA